MKKTVSAIIGVFMISAVAGFASFTPPTTAQIAAAANNPAGVAALLQGASSEQAAQVIKSVIVQALALGLDTQAANTRVANIVTAGFSANPTGSAPLLAANLGTACGLTLAISGHSSVVSAIQNAIISANGTKGNALAAAFGSAFVEAEQGAANNGGNKGNVPPITTGYEGQR